MLPWDVSTCVGVICEGHGYLTPLGLCMCMCELCLPVAACSVCEDRLRGEFTFLNSTPPFPSREDLGAFCRQVQYKSTSTYLYLQGRGAGGGDYRPQLFISRCRICLYPPPPISTITRAPPPPPKKKSVPGA